MRRSVTLISAAVTMFSLVVLVSVVYAYRGYAASASSAPLNPNQSIKTVQVADAASSQAASVSPQTALAQPTNLSAQAAASIAAQYLHRTDLFSAQLASYKGAQAFKITFSSGAVVYVSMTGQVLGEELPPTYSAAAPFRHRSGGGAFRSNSYSGSSSGGQHEDGSEHESGDSSSDGGE